MHNAKVIMTKTIVSLKEFLNEHMCSFTDKNLSPHEEEWGRTLGLTYSNADNQLEKRKDWQIRMPDESFRNWNKEMDFHSLSFDGAEKGNPRNTGAGGVIKNKQGQTEHRYAWGLGQDTNTQAEALELLQGIKILQKMSIKEANIIGDSQTLIKMLLENSNPKDLRLSRLMERIRKTDSFFQKIRFFHVLRGNNKEDDMEANRATLLPTSTLVWNDKEIWTPIP